MSQDVMNLNSSFRENKPYKLKDGDVRYNYLEVVQIIALMACWLNSLFCSSLFAGRLNELCQDSFCWVNKQLHPDIYCKLLQ